MIVINERLLAIRELLTGHLGESGVPEMEQLLKTVGLVASACQVTDISKLLPNREAQAELSAEPQPGGRTTRSAGYRLAQRAGHQPRRCTADAGESQTVFCAVRTEPPRTVDD